MKFRANILVVLAAIVSLGLAFAACGGSKPAATAEPTIAAPTAVTTTTGAPASSTDTPLSAAPPVTQAEVPIEPIEPEMVLIPAGEFTMGSEPRLDQDAVDNEQPQHTLYLPDFFLAKAPVTNAQYAAFLRATGHPAPYHWGTGAAQPGKADHPVVDVSWHDAVAYCNWLAEVTGKPYRLPSEAEWEKGARGSDGRIYPWGNKSDAARYNGREGGKGDTTPVGAYPEGASPYGALDMAGNVWEWTSSVYEAYPYDPADGREDLTGGADVRRVLRGGAYGNLAWRVRSAFRGSDLPDFAFWDRGFRVALDSD